MTNWLYDPSWRAFVRWQNGVRHIIYEESIEGADDGPTAATIREAFAVANGLGLQVRDRLRADPVPGSYNGSQGPWEIVGSVDTGHPRG